MNTWIENTLLPLVCAFGLGVAVATNAAEHAAPAQPERTQASGSECPPVGVPASRPHRVIVAEVRP